MCSLQQVSTQQNLSLIIKVIRMTPFLLMGGTCKAISILLVNAYHILCHLQPASDVSKPQLRKTYQKDPYNVNHTEFPILPLGSSS